MATNPAADTIPRQRASARKSRPPTPSCGVEWEAYRSAPDAPRPPIALSNLLVAMAPHVSRFVTRLFHIQPSVDALTRATRDQDDLFRFKVDFVRRRVLPLVKGGAHVVSTPEDDAVVAAMIAGTGARQQDLELAIARAGCALLDAEKAGGQRQSRRSTASSAGARRGCTIARTAIG